MAGTLSAALYSPAKDFEVHQVQLFTDLPLIGHIVKVRGRKYPVESIEWSEQKINGTDYLSPIIVVGRQVV
jgi:hypothetical protein